MWASLSPHIRGGRSLTSKPIQLIDNLPVNSFDPIKAALRAAKGTNFVHERVALLIKMWKLLFDFRNPALLKFRRRRARAARDSCKAK